MPYTLRMYAGHVMAYTLVAILGMLFIFTILLPTLLCQEQDEL